MLKTAAPSGTTAASAATPPTNAPYWRLTKAPPGVATKPMLACRRSGLPPDPSSCGRRPDGGSWRTGAHQRGSAAHGLPWAKGVVAPQPPWTQRTPAVDSRPVGRGGARRRVRAGAAGQDVRPVCARGQPGVRAARRPAHGPAARGRVPPCSPSGGMRRAAGLPGGSRRSSPMHATWRFCVNAAAVTSSGTPGRRIASPADRAVHNRELDWVRVTVNSANGTALP
jgi:hypothetical protein